MKYLLITSFFISCLFTLSKSQDLPIIHYSDFGYNRAVESVRTVHYALHNGEFIEVENEFMQFNSDGNVILNQRINTYDSTKEFNFYTYENGQLTRLKTESSVPAFNKDVNYTYDKNGNLIASEDIRISDIINKEYTYTNDQLSAMTVIDGDTKFIVSYEYAKNGDLVRVLDEEYKNDELVATYTTTYLENKRVISYMNEGEYVYADLYFPHLEAKLTVFADTESEQNFVQLANQISKDAFAGEPTFDLATFSAQGMATYEANTDEVELYSLFNIHKNEFNDELVRAEILDYELKVDLISFSEISYMEGPLSGSTEFNAAMVQQFESLYNQE